MWQEGAGGMTVELLRTTTLDKVHLSFNLESGRLIQLAKLSLSLMGADLSFFLQGQIQTWPLELVYEEPLLTCVSYVYMYTCVDLYCQYTEEGGIKGTACAINFIIKRAQC